MKTIITLYNLYFSDNTHDITESNIKKIGGGIQLKNIGNIGNIKIDKKQKIH